MYNEEPHIVELFELIHCHNPISGHQWTEHGRSIGFFVHGGGWPPTRHKTLPAAESELFIRKQMLQERALIGE